MITVAAEPFRATVAVTGTLVSNARVDVKAEVIGRITRFDKEEGAHVAAGEAVAWVNDENYQLALRQAETGVKVAEAGAGTRPADGIAQPRRSWIAPRTC